jgi:uncharacterized protein (TIGR02145 family)
LSDTVTSFGSNGIQSSATISDDGCGTITERGIVWGTSAALSNQTTFGEGSGSFNWTINNLSIGVTYFYRAFAVNLAGKSYSDQKEFRITSLASVELINIDQITCNSVRIRSSITSNGGLLIKEKGVVYSTNQNPTINNNLGRVVSTNSDNQFFITIQNLLANTTYFVRSYVINDNGTSYSSQSSVKTNNLSITTNNATNIGATQVSIQGNISNACGGNVVERGIVYHTSNNPTYNSHPKASNGSGLGVFNTLISSLIPDTKYFARAYARTSEGAVYYGNMIEFTTKFLCGVSKVIDIEGNVYNTVFIDNRCWLKENLKVSKFSDRTSIPTHSTPNFRGEPGKAIYGGIQSNLNTYGYLYNFAVASSGKNICPNGFRVPTQNELNSLIRGKTASDLKATTGWSTLLNGTDKFGFKALPGGYLNSNGQYTGILNAACFWSKELFCFEGCAGAWGMLLNNNIEITNRFLMSDYLSIRCVDDVVF